MNKEPSSFNLSPEKLAQLWGVGLDVDCDDLGIEQEQKKAELLRDWLSTTLPLNRAAVRLWPKIVSHLCEQLLPFAGDSFDRLLEDPKTDISALKQIKDFGKKLVEGAQSEVEHDAAAAIYYAAIASALVFHGRRITTLSYEDLTNSFSALLESSWLTPNLVRLFKKAHKFCQRTAKGKKRKA